MSFTLLDDQQVSVTAIGVDDQGNPSGPLPAGATAMWATSDSSVLTATQDATNPLAALVKTTGKVAAGTQVTVSVTLPGATSPLTGMLTIDVVPSAMVSIGITPGTPAPRT